MTFSSVGKKTADGGEQHGSASLVLEMARKPSLSEQSADAIVAGIAAGVLRPGQRLVEAELAGMLQISRAPLREALKILEAQGIVASTPHRGTFVPHFDDVRITQICEARIALEKIATRQAAQVYSRSPELLLRLEAIVNEMELAAARLAWMDISRADLKFHREICQVSGNMVVLTLWETLARHVLIVFGHEIRDERDARSLGPQHRRLRDLLSAGETDKLMVEVESHIMRLRNRGGPGG